MAFPLDEWVTSWLHCRPFHELEFLLHRLADRRQFTESRLKTMVWSAITSPQLYCANPMRRSRSAKHGAAASYHTSARLSADARSPRETLKLLGSGWWWWRSQWHRDRREKLNCLSETTNQGRGRTLNHLTANSLMFAVWRSALRFRKKVR